jgi:hypothetical protein
MDCIFGDVIPIGTGSATTSAFSTLKCVIATSSAQAIFDLATVFWVAFGILIFLGSIRVILWFFRS